MVQLQEIEQLRFKVIALVQSYSRPEDDRCAVSAVREFAFVCVSVSTTVSLNWSMNSANMEVTQLRILIFCDLEIYRKYFETLAILTTVDFCFWFTLRWEMEEDVES